MAKRKKVGSLRFADDEDDCEYGYWGGLELVAVQKFDFFGVMYHIFAFFDLRFPLGTKS